jgi:acetyl-CoA C-acetyltransferase
MHEKVGIVAWHQAPYKVARDDVNFPEMVYPVVKSLIGQLGISVFDIDQAITCSSDFWDGKTISNLAINEVVGAYLRSESKVASDGTQALFYAMTRILSGETDSALVVAHCKMSMVEPNQVTWGAGDPFFMRPAGVDDLNAAGLQANAYMNATGATEQQCARVVVKNKGNALMNPVAQSGQALSVEEVMQSPYLCDPIKDLDRAPYSDGACGLILVNEKKAKEWSNRPPVWIAGAGSCNDLYFFSDRNLARFGMLEEAAKKAYAMAGITDPLKEIDVAELSESYSYQELMICEGLGLCPPGKGGDLVDEGVTSIGGQLPVNPSGGMLGGCPDLVVGLNAIIEGAKQLSSDAGKHQVDGAKVALAHGKNGFNGQQNTVVVLKSDQ